MAGWCAMTQKSIETLLDAARLAGLETTEGGRILAKVSRPDAKGTSYRSALVEIDGEGLLPLTRGSGSVGAVAAAEDGTTSSPRSAWARTARRPRTPSCGRCP